MNPALLLNSLWVSGVVAILALLLGGVGLLVVAGWSRRAQALWVGAAVLTLVVPPFVVLNAWMNLFGAGGACEGWLPFRLFSAGTAVVVMGLIYWPVPFLLMLGGWQRVSPVLMESEPRLRGFALLRWLWWPAVRPGALVGGVVVLVLALNQFTVPALLQVRTYPAEMWMRYNAGAGGWEVLWLSWPLVLAPLLLLIVVRARRIAWPRWNGEGTESLWRRRISPTARRLAAGVAVVTVFLSLALPLIQLIADAGTWEDLAPALQASLPAVFHSMALAGATACAVLVAAWLTAERRWVGGLWIAFLVPGVVLGVLMIQVFNRPWLSAFYQGFGVVVLAWGIRFFAPAWAAVRLGVTSIDPVFRDVLTLEGAGPWDRFRLVLWPQARATVIAAWYLVYLLCLWDTETLVLIMPPGGETLALRIFNFLHYGHNAQVNALCLVLLIVALLPMVAWALCRWGIRLRREGLMPLVALPALLTVLAATIGCRPADAHSAQLSSRLFSGVVVIGERGAGVGQFQKPRSLAVDAEDNVYVVDMTGRVQKFSGQGVHLTSWQMPETDIGRPKGMCRDAQGNIVVLEPHYARVNHFSPTGELMEQWGRRGTNTGELSFPRAVVAAPDGRLFVSEYMQRERVQVFSAQREVLSTVGGAGRGVAELNRAEGLALDRRGQLYVADSCNHRVQVFDSDLGFIREYGGAGSGKGEFSYPYDIAVDEEGRQYVCEFGNSRIQVFDPAGDWLETIGRPGSAPGEFSNPWAVALDSQGNLYVADSMNHRVQKLIRRPDSA